MNNLDMDSGLAAVVDHVRELHDPIKQALTDGRPVAEYDLAALAGAVWALLDAIDARLPQGEQQAVKAVA